MMSTHRAMQASFIKHGNGNGKLRFALVCPCDHLARSSEKVKETHRAVQWVLRGAGKSEYMDELFTQPLASASGRGDGSW